MKIVLRFRHIELGLILLAVGLVACSGEQKPFDGFSSTSTFSGKIVVTSVATDPATGPGLVSLWNSNGTFALNLRDLSSSGEFAAGSGFFGPDKIILSVDGVDRLEVLNLSTNTSSSITNANLNATPLRQVAVSTNTNTILITESNSNTVEKFTLGGARVGAPFLPATVGTCALSSPWGVAILPNEDIVVISSPAAAGRFSKYDKDGNCLAHVTAAPFATGTPTAVAYHAPTGKLLVTFATTHAIFAMNLSGASATQIFLNSSIINTPRSIATDSSGYIYVGSSGTDTVEKLYWSGTGNATRATSGPFLGPGIFTQNPTSITVIP